MTIQVPAAQFPIHLPAGVLRKTADDDFSTWAPAKSLGNQEEIKREIKPEFQALCFGLTPWQLGYIRSEPANEGQSLSFSLLFQINLFKMSSSRIDAGFLLSRRYYHQAELTC